MMGRKQKLSGAEHDVVSGWREVLCYLARPRVKKKIRKAMNKRERREAREALRGGDD